MRPHITQLPACASVNRLPSWFKQDLPDTAKVQSIKTLLRGSNLHTVCESALCPNMGQCWGRGVATFMILGDICTRACRFCAIPVGYPQEVDPLEPLHVARAAQKLNLKYVVVTSVARDDLEDEGSGQFVLTVNEVRKLLPRSRIELLIPDFSNRKELLKKVVNARPDVLAHNMETVRRLFNQARHRADYARSLNVLKTIKELNPFLLVKTSFMVGLGETWGDIEALMADIREQGCDMLTIGQYLAPLKTARYLPVKRFVTPQEFEEMKTLGLRLGFRHVMSGPLVRSSYIAETGYRECQEILHQV